MRLRKSGWIFGALATIALPILWFAIPRAPLPASPQAAIEAAGDRAQSATDRMVRGLDRLEPNLSPAEKRKALSIAAQLLGKVDPQG